MASRLGISVALLALATVVGGAAAGASGCEVIVPSDIATPPCTMTPYVDPGNGTCPSGMFCFGAGCKACEAKDFCDGYDNDCDGIIDDGPSSDFDGDGYTKCGKSDPATGGVAVAADCDDTNKAIYPGAKEICNGLDDNCDHIIDNANLVCPLGETCVPATGLCISTAKACVLCSVSNVDGCCPDPNVCDKGTQQCVPNGTQDAGTSCSGDKACSTGICSNPTELGSGQTIATCTKPCCTSDDCDPGSICWGAGTGGNYCIPGSAVSRPALGAGEPGTACSAGGDCRSGVCTANKCEDTCCNGGNCQNGTTCAATTFAGVFTLACVAAPGSTPTDSSCASNAQCASGFCACYSTDNFDDCHPSPNRNAVQLCAQPCCSSKQCPMLTSGMFAGNQFVCNDDYAPPALSGSVVPICDGVQQGKQLSNGTIQPPTGQVGDTCSAITDCYSNLCGVPSAPTKCTDVCCVDADCGKAGWVCRPTPSGTGTFLRCVPAPT